jgi:hypothetical protein
VGEPDAVFLTAPAAGNRADIAPIVRASVESTRLGSDAGGARRNATLLACMDSKAMAQLSSPYALDIQLDPILQPRCTPNGGAAIYPQIPNNLWGSYTSTIPACCSTWMIQLVVLWVACLLFACIHACRVRVLGRTPGFCHALT